MNYNRNDKSGLSDFNQKGLKNVHLVPTCGMKNVHNDCILSGPLLFILYLAVKLMYIKNG